MKGFLCEGASLPQISEENNVINFARTCAYLQGEMEVLLCLTVFKTITKNCSFVPLTVFVLIYVALGTYES